MVVAAMAYDTAGNSEKFILEDNDEDKSDIRVIVPRACVKVNENELYLFAVRGYERVAGKAMIRK